MWHVMCGRYAASREPEDLAGLFGVEKWEPEETLAPDWNVAPTKEVYAVLDRPLKDAGRPASGSAAAAAEMGARAVLGEDRPRAARG